MDKAVELFLRDFCHSLFKVRSRFGPRDDIHISAFSHPESFKVLARRVSNNAEQTSPKFHRAIIAQSVERG